MNRLLTKTPQTSSKLSLVLTDAGEKTDFVCCERPHRKMRAEQTQTKIN